MLRTQFRLHINQNIRTIKIFISFVFPLSIYVHIQMYADNLSIKAKELKREKKKSDTLLFQMLPLSVATQLKQTRKVCECN